MPTHRIHYLGAVGLVLMIGLAPTAAAGSAPPLGSRPLADSAQASSKIAFMTAVSPFGRRVVYVMNADGRGKRSLARTAHGGEAPTWSPDGRRLAFEVRLPTSRVGQCGDCNAEVFVVNSDGSGQQNLTRNPAGDGVPAWSPDGQTIAFGSSRDGDRETAEIYVMNADGSEQRNLTRDPAQDWGPVWSPEGQQIAFVRVVGGVGNDRNGEIYVMNADGSGQRRLTGDPAFDGHPVWSPDGRQIAFTRSRIRTGIDVFVMNADGSGQRNLTRNPTRRGPSPVWSPDGRKLAFVSDRDGNDEIYVMNADGSGQRNLTRYPARDGHPVWSPDGGKIGFVSNRGGNRDIYVMNPDGSEPRNLTRDIRQQTFGLAWSPARSG